MHFANVTVELPELDHLPDVTVAEILDRCAHDPDVVSAVAGCQYWAYQRLRGDLRGTRAADASCRSSCGWGGRVGVRARLAWAAATPGVAGPDRRTLPPAGLAELAAARGRRAGPRTTPPVRLVRVPGRRRDRRQPVVIRFATWRLISGDHHHNHPTPVAQRRQAAEHRADDRVCCPLGLRLRLTYRSPRTPVRGPRDRPGTGSG
jgi:hypothetical protein